jgi:hypothetical protein
MKKVYVFDLDHTITNEHTKGYYESEYKMYITDTMLDKTKILFKYIKDNKDKIYINSRGLLSSVFAFCKDAELLEYIDGIYAAKDSKIPHSSIHMVTKYNLSSSGWTHHKTNYLDLIRKREDVERENMYFFDDNEHIIQNALDSEYANSYQVDSNRYPLITDKYNMVCTLFNLLKQ